jgi:chitin synthase
MDSIVDFFQILYFSWMFLIFILSLGNRPQGFKALYLVAMVLFAIVMVIILSIGLVVTYQGLTTPSTTTSNYDAPFVLLLLALITTYGVYFGASFMYGDPWHMFSSFLQYMMLLPSYTNILMVYAFCNTHDVSWGTKGDNTYEHSDLGVVKMIKGDGKAQLVEVSVPDLTQMEKRGMDMWEEKKMILKQRPEKRPIPRDATTKRDDYYRQFRTLFLLSWVLSNGLLVFVTSSQTLESFEMGHGTFNPYLLFVVLFVAVMSVIRALGSMWFLIDEVIGELRIRLAQYNQSSHRQQEKADDPIDNEISGQLV